MIIRNEINEVYNIYCKEDFNKIAQIIALNIYKGQVINVIIDVHTNEYDIIRSKSTTSIRNKGGWRKHTYEDYESSIYAKGPYHIRSKTHNIEELIIVHYRPRRHNYIPPDFLTSIYKELDIIKDRIVTENIIVNREKDLLP